MSEKDGNWSKIINATSKNTNFIKRLSKREMLRKVFMVNMVKDLK